jgi:hypothetical protein
MPPPPFLYPPPMCRYGCVQGGGTPLHYAAFGDHVACVTLLVERGANVKAKIKVRCDERAIFFHAAAAFRFACCCGCALHYAGVTPPPRISCDARVMPCCADVTAAFLRRCAALLWMCRKATRRCTSPLTWVTSNAWHCCWSAAPTRRQRATCAALRTLPPLLRTASARPRLRSAALCRAHSRRHLPARRREALWLRVLFCLPLFAPGNSPAPAAALCQLTSCRADAAAPLLRCSAAALRMRAGWRYAAALRRGQ